MEQSKLINSKFVNKVVAILLVFCLITANYALIGLSIVEATDEILEDATITKNSNIEFDAYFMGSTEVATKTPVLNSAETQKLFLKLNVKDQVSLVDGKIKLENPNFTIKEDELEANDYVKNVNVETNEIEIKKIYSNTDVIIELPIQFNKQDRIESNYFEKEIEINLTGKYENSKQKQKNLKGKVTVRPQWNADAKVNLTQSVEKFFNLGENGTIFQEKVTTEVVDNVLPRRYERIEVAIPSIAEQKPSQVVILVDGEHQNSSNVSYDIEQQKLIITKVNNQDKEGKAEWGKDKIEYTLAFKYDNKIETKENPILLNAKSTTSLYTKAEEIQNEANQDAVITPIGSVVTVSTGLYGDIYKGYIYHNEAKETEYKEKNDVEISYVDESLEKLELQTNTSAFLNEAGVKVADSPSVTYKQTQFQKQELFNILGNEGKVTIKRPNGEVISEVTNDTQTDDKGIITVSYANPEPAIVIETTKPRVEGRITVLNTKALGGQTNQNINALKIAKYLATASEVTTNLSKETNTATIELKEPTSEVDLTSSVNKISTLKSTNVEFNAVLLSSNEKQELFKNPTLQIKLPAEIENININSVNKVNANEFEIGQTNLLENNGQKIIDIKLVGEQIEHLSNDDKGIQVVINADLTPTQKSQNVTSNIEMSYTNANTGNVIQTMGLEFAIDTEKAILYNKLMQESQMKIAEATKGQIVGNAITQNIDGLQIVATPSTVGKEIKDGGEVYEGQTIRYDITVTNNTGKEVTGLNLEAKQLNDEGENNVTYFNYVIEDGAESTDNQLTQGTYYQEDETINSMNMSADTIAINETKSFKYEFVIKSERKEHEITKGTLDVKAEGIQGQVKLLENQIKMGKLKLTTKYSYNEEVNFEAGATTIMSYFIKNTTNQKLENITGAIIIPKETAVSGIFGDGIIDQNKDYLTFKFDELQPNEEKVFLIYFDVKPILLDLSEENYDFYCMANVDEEDYYSNEINKTAYQRQIKLEMSQVADLDKEYAETGDVITYTTTVINKSNTSEKFYFSDYVPEILNKQQLYLKDGEETVELEILGGTTYQTEYELQPNKTVQIILKAQVGENTQNISEFSHYTLVYNVHQSAGEDTKITYKIKPNITTNIQPSPIPSGNPGDTPSDTPGGSAGTETPGTQGSSGSSEGYQENQNGSGSYENAINGENTGSETFDLSLQKTVSKITTYTSKGKTENNFENTNLAKVEIHRKEINGAKVLIDYIIKVTNEGQTPGAISSIVDYLPSGFEIEDSPEWTVKDGKAYNQSLAEQIIYPGESKEIKLTISRSMTDNSTGVFANTAEIAEVINESSLEDNDSIPGNKKDGEDDMSTAEVVISIGTGLIEKIAWTISVLLGFVIIGIVIYKVKVEEEKRV